VEYTVTSLSDSIISMTDNSFLHSISLNLSFFDDRKS